MVEAAEAIPSESKVQTSRKEGDALLVRFEGDWTTGAKLPPADPVLAEMGSGVKSVAFDMQDVAGWDSSLLTFLLSRRFREFNF